MQDARRPVSRLIPVLLGVCAAACATSPLGRSQLLLFPEGEMAKMGAIAFDQTKGQTPASTDAAKTRYVRCVAQAIAGEVTGPAGEQGWEVTLFEDEQANAFALPGGKIGVTPAC